MKCIPRERAMKPVVLLAIAAASVAGSAAQAATTTTTSATSALITAMTTYYKNLNYVYPPESAYSSYVRGQTDMAKSMADYVAACARMVQADGAATLTNAQALQSLESARTQAIENRVKAATNFYEKRKLYEAQRLLAKGPAVPRKKAAPGGAPGGDAGRADSDPVDPTSGRVAWPAIFLRSEFLAERVQLDALFADRSRKGGRIATEVRPAAGQMQQQLRELIRQVPPGEYAAAKRFLACLIHAADAPASFEGVAGN
jgi:hypothetical protein